MRKQRIRRVGTQLAALNTVIALGKPDLTADDDVRVPEGLLELGADLLTCEALRLRRSGDAEHGGNSEHQGERLTGFHEM